MLQRFPHHEYEYADVFDEGTRWMRDEEVVVCTGCGLILGPEWWICPSCERWWLDSQDRPDWPVFYCSHCGSWEPHELLWRSKCYPMREPDPRHVEVELRGDEGEAAIDHFSDEHVDMSVGEPLRRRTPLDVETDRIGRPMTEAERGALGLSNVTGSYISPDAHRGRSQICGRRPGCRV